MNKLIDEIMQESGEVQDAAAYRRYLGTLDGRALQERLAGLRATADRTGARGQNSYRHRKPRR